MKSRGTMRQSYAFKRRGVMSSRFVRNSFVLLVFIVQLILTASEDGSSLAIPPDLNINPDITPQEYDYVTGDGQNETEISVVEPDSNYSEERTGISDLNSTSEEFTEETDSTQIQLRILDLGVDKQGYHYRTVNKCCQFNQRYDIENGVCVDGSEGDVNMTNLTRIMMVNSSLSMMLWREEVQSDYSTLGSVDSVQFRLKIAMPECAASKITRKIIHMDGVGQSQKPFLARTLESQSLLLSTSGYLVWQDSSGYMNTLPSSDFCMDQINETAFVALLCKEECTEAKPCIRKCCPPDTFLDLGSESCLVTRNQWSPKIRGLDGSLLLNSSLGQTRFTYGLPNCTGKYLLSRAMHNDIKEMDVRADRSLIVRFGEKKEIFSPDMYCTDVDDRNSGASQQQWSEMDQITIACNPSEDDVEGSSGQSAQDEPPWKYVVNGIGAFISAFFLTLTGLVYLITWSHQNIHGWLQFAYVVSCIQAYTILGILQFAYDSLKDHNTYTCEVMGGLLHWSFLSAFFWLTSMNFDIWWTFSGYRPLTPRSKTGEIKRYCFFALFSWGCAAIIAGTGFTLDILYKDSPDKFPIRPNFGKVKCYFAEQDAQFVYFFGPLGVLLLFDLSFFLHTVYSLHKLQQDTRFATQQSSHQEKKKFLLFVKLFVVMGVLWLFEFLSAVARYFDPDNKKTWDTVFLSFDIINSLQGFLVFFIFCCKLNTCRQLEGQFKKLSVFLEECRDKGVGKSFWMKARSCVLIAVIMFTLPIVHLFRKMFSSCGRRRRSITGRHHPSHNTTLTSTMVFDKFRKTSSTSTTTSSISVKDPGAYELEISNLHL